MKATIKTGGKQYNVCVGDVLAVEKIDAKVGDKINLSAICIIDGDKIEADPAKASKTAVKAEVLEQFKDKKVIVFKFKRRKNYKVKNGHRQNLTKLRIIEIGSEKYVPTKKAKPVAKKAVKKDKATKAAKPAEKKTDSKSTASKVPAKSTTKSTAKPATKKSSTKSAATSTKKPAAKAPAKTSDKKEAPAKKPAEKK